MEYVITLSSNLDSLVSNFPHKHHHNLVNDNLGFVYLEFQLTPTMQQHFVYIRTNGISAIMCTGKQQTSCSEEIWW